MRIRFFLSLIFIYLINICHAQQHGLYSQYIFNLFAINPAYAGELDALATSLSYRTQWVGFEGAPKTQNFNIHSPINAKNMALGLQIQNDEIGARRTPSASLAYSYKIRINKKAKLSFGLQFGVINYQYRWDELNYRDQIDPVAYSGDMNKWIPNFDFGVMYINTNGYIGFSATSLNNSQVNENVSSDARLSTYFNLMAGKIFKISRQVSLKPSTILRKSIGSPYQFDVNLSARYKNRFWLTTTYRYDFGMVFSGHIFITEKMHFGYSYDLPLNSLLSQQSGTHELFLGYNFNIYRSSKTKP